MHRSIRGAALLVGMIALAAPNVDAQERSAKFGLAAGATFPTGDFGIGYSSGFHVNGLIAIQPPTSSIGWRFEGTYTSFTPDLASSDFRVLSGIGNVVIGGSGTGTASPFFLGGLGVYNGKAEEGEDSSTDFGLNAGVGLKIPLSGFDTFVEARFHNVFTSGASSRWIPITFGILF